MGKIWSFLRPQLHTDWCPAKWLSCEWFQNLLNINWIEFHINRNGGKRQQHIKAKFCGNRAGRLVQFQVRRNSTTLQVFVPGNESTTSYVCLGKEKKQVKPGLLNGKRTDAVFAEAGIYLMHRPPLLSTHRWVATKRHSEVISEQYFK